MKLPDAITRQIATGWEKPVVGTDDAEEGARKSAKPSDIDTLSSNLKLRRSAIPLDALFV